MADPFQPVEKPPLFRSRKDDPETSREAAVSANKRGRGRDLKRRILAALKEYPKGVSYFTIADYLDVPPQDISSLFTEIDRAGDLYRTGATQKGPKGAKRLLFWLTPAGGKPDNAIDPPTRGKALAPIHNSVVEHDWLDGSGCCGVLKSTDRGVYCNECGDKFEIIAQHVHENAVMFLEQGAKALVHIQGRLATDMHTAAKMMKGIK